MVKVATLGPVNTFSEVAARKYIEMRGLAATVELYPTFGKAFASVGTECAIAVLPIENLAEGYVTIVLDLLVYSTLSIVDELLLPIQFSLAGNCASVDKIERIYSQFVSQGQCEGFLDSLHDVAMITTQSNGTSLEKVREGRAGEAAIVPAFAVKPGDFPLVVEGIADRVNNQTRFIAVAPQAREYDASKAYKTSLLIAESVDRAGILAEMLTAFAKRRINLVSIMSRPTKEMMGRYHFFIDVEGYCTEPRIREALEEIMRENTIRNLGSYPRALKPSV